MIVIIGLLKFVEMSRDSLNSANTICYVVETGLVVVIDVQLLKVPIPLMRNSEYILQFLLCFTNGNRNSSQSQYFF